MQFNIDVLILDISNGICTLSTPSKNLETVSPERAAASARDPKTAVLMFDNSSGCEHWETAMPTNIDHDATATGENPLHRKQKKRARQKTKRASSMTNFELPEQKKAPQQSTNT